MRVIFFTIFAFILAIIFAKTSECGFIGVDSVAAKNLIYYGNNEY